MPFLLTPRSLLSLSSYKTLTLRIGFWPKTYFIKRCQQFPCKCGWLPNPYLKRHRLTTKKTKNNNKTYNISYVYFFPKQINKLHRHKQCWPVSKLIVNKKKYKKKRNLSNSNIKHPVGCHSSKKQYILWRERGNHRRSLV